MRIGITYDLKGDATSTAAGPDDLFEEFDSPVTVESIAGELRGLGHDVVKLGDGRELLQRLLADPPDFVFNFAEGNGIGRSREARVPAVLEMLGIPYSGSDPLTLAVTLDKDCAKRLVAMAGVAVPQGVVITPANAELKIENLQLSIFNFPVIAKPAWEGSSKGIRQTCVAENIEELRRAVPDLLRDYQQPVLIEEYIRGEEVTVGVYGNNPPQVLGVMRVLPNQPTDRFIYSVEVKRDYKHRVQYECPARLPPAALQAIAKAALDSWHALSCRDIARVDFRLRDGVPYFLEVNPLPGLNPNDSDLVIMAKLAGWDYAKLIRTILSAALARHGL